MTKTNEKPISVSHDLTELDREMIAASRLNVRDIGRSLGAYLLSTSGEFSPVPKNTARVAVVDSETGLAVADVRVNDVEVSGFLGSVSDKLIAVHFADLGVFEEPKNSSIKRQKGFLPKAAIFGGMVRMEGRRFAKSRKWISIPTLNKTTGEGVCLFWTGTVAELKTELTTYFGYDFNVSEMMLWARRNHEKSFKALSASTMVGTEYRGNDLVVVALPSVGFQGDGFGVMSNTNAFVLQNEIALGEFFQLRGNPVSHMYGYVKGDIATLLPEHVLAVAEKFFKADPEILKFIQDNMDRVLVTTTDVVKRQEPGIYAMTRVALNCRGNKKERTSITLGQQAATRYQNAMMSPGNALLSETERIFQEILDILTDCAFSPFTESKRLRLLALMKHMAIVLHSDDGVDEDGDEKFASAASATQDFDEVYTILSRPGATLEEANRQGKLVEAVQSLIRSGFRTQHDGYAAYACPAEVVEIVSGFEMKEGEVYLPKDMARKMKWRIGEYLGVARDPRLKHAVVPYMLSGINCYLRCIAVKGYLGRPDLLHQMDFDGDTLSAVRLDVVKMDFDAAVKAIKETIAATIKWVEAGSNLEELPCFTYEDEVELVEGGGKVTVRIARAAIIRPMFGSWNADTKTFVPAPGEKSVPYSGYEQKEGSTCYYKVIPIYVWGTEKDWPADIKDDIIATISAISSAKGIEMADALASRAAIDFGKMLTWDMVQFVQKVIEGCKHGSGGILPDVQTLSGQRPEGIVEASTMFFTLKSKTKGAGARWTAHYEQQLQIASGELKAKFAPGAPNIQSIIKIGRKLARVMAKLAEMPRTGTLRCDQKLSGKHDKVLAWLCGDPTLSHMADALFEGADFSLHALERLLHYYLLATMQMRELREALRTMQPGEARAFVEKKTGSKLITISAAKRATKARILQFARWLVFMHENGFRLPAPDSFKKCGRYTNAVYSESTLNYIKEAVRPAGLDWDPLKNDKVNPLYAFEAKYPRHYQGLNALIDDCVDEETALGIVASFLFRVGTSPLADNGMAKSAYLYFVGEMVTVQMASMMTVTKGKKFYCPVVGQNAVQNEEGSP